MFLPALPRPRWLILAVLGLCLGAAAWWWGMSGGHGIGSSPRPGPAAPPAPWKVVTALGGARGLADGAPGDARFDDPYGVAVDAQGIVYVTDAGDNNRIRRLGADGAVSTLAGGAEGFRDGQGAEARFHTPSGLAVDRAGNVYVADTGNHAVRKITPAGAVSTLAGDGHAGERDGPGHQARFNGPLGVAVDAQGHVYVADTYNDRIRRIAPDGQVSTLAGGDRPGFADGVGDQARFDTPCAIAVDAHGRMAVADTRNHAIRRITPQGEVSTLARPAPDDEQSLLRRPLALAPSADGAWLVAVAQGRLVSLSATGALTGVVGVGIDIAVGDPDALRLAQPTALAATRDGGWWVSDPAVHGLRRLVRAPASQPAPLASVPSGAVGSVAAVNVSAEVRAKASADADADVDAKAAPLLWPVAPQRRAHEIVGTVGEVRGKTGGDARDHFHAGVDVQANLGSPVLAIEAAKVQDPLPAWGYGSLNEGLALDGTAYIHLRVGRTAQDEVTDARRFLAVRDMDDRPRIRVRRGTRFAVGDTLGTVNRMYHVHLERYAAGQVLNPLRQGFVGYRDKTPPRIEHVALHDATGAALQPDRHGRVHLRRDAAGLDLVVAAYDQIDGNAARRRLGLYQLGYQVLLADGRPAPGHEQPRTTLVFNRLPPDREAVRIAYAEGSGETVHGHEATVFRYVLNHTVRDGRATEGHWSPGDLPPGPYLIRVRAQDAAGNEATVGRDLRVVLD